MPRLTYVERADRFDAEVAAALVSEHQLVVLLDRPGLDSYERLTVVAALGDSGTGPDGSAAVRAQFSDALTRLANATKSTRSDWRDNACAAVITLAKRDGPTATDVYLAAIESANPAARGYGLDVLAVEGDDRAWDFMFAKVRQAVQRKPISVSRWHELIQAVEYLARHSARGTTRAEQLVTLLRANWDRLASPPLIKIRRADQRGRHTETETATRFEDLWPGIHPAGPPAADLDLPRLHAPSAWWN
jgi:hypothetical protein